MKRLSRAALLTGVFALCAPLAAQPLDGTLKKIKDTGALTIGYRDAAIPFSYLDEALNPVGYAIDLCLKVVDAVRAELALPDLKLRWQSVTSVSRIPLVEKGRIDIECGSTTNTAERQRQVAFGPTYFVSQVAVAVRKASGIESVSQLGGRTVATTAGTTSIALLRQFGKGAALEVNEVYGRDHLESFLLLERNRADAWVLDDVLMAGQIASALKPDDFRILPERLSREAFSMMFRRNDPAFKALVDRTISGLMRSGEIVKIYEKWFTRPIPPKGINLNLPLSPENRKAFDDPNDRPA
jgi:glutamate/aspartate transport system substrate-binding protein